MNSQVFQEWEGRQVSAVEVISVAHANAMNATMDAPMPDLQTGDKLPELWHWIYFNGACRQAEIGEDGHPQRGGFLPPISLPRRMWAGGELQFMKPIPVGAEVIRTSTINRIQKKSGRTGDLFFVEVEHAIANNDEIYVRELQSIVYKGPSVRGAQSPETALAPVDFEWTRTIRPDPVLLFRYSALTFNGHRIHYDKTYATEEEGYPHLVVHGPLLATLLMNLLRSEMPVAEIKNFKFRAIRPTFLGNCFHIRGKQESDGQVSVWACDHDGYLTMSATAQLG